VNTNGTTGSSLPYPISATADSLFGNTELFGGLTNVTPIFTINGLNPSSTYNFTFYASRIGPTDIRTTDYTVTGSNSSFATLDAAGNVNTTVSVLAISPTAGGVITIALTPSATNNNANHFIYLGTLEFAASPIPEPMTAGLILSGAMVLVLRRKRLR
jgi:hypothetical protein